MLDPTPRADKPFVFLHIGDQHLTAAGARNAADLDDIFAQIAGLPRDAYDFVYLPGDIAENGLAAEYALIDAGLRRHEGIPLHLIPGDHDRQYGSMSDFDAFHGAHMAPRHPVLTNDLDQPPTGPAGCPPSMPIRQYYHAATYGNVRAVFLDMISAGFGQKGKGLDFRLGRYQMEWLSGEVEQARREGKTCAVFMHTYPDDLEDKEAQEVAGLFWSQRVRLVEMGHTHYNELAHDGRTTYAAARSVGQNEDGSVGYAVGALDGGEASWRFRALDRTWPFVLITSPVDRRLATRTADLRADGTLVVRAVVLSDRAPRLCRCRVDDGPWRPMTSAGSAGLFEGSVDLPSGSRRIEVQAIHPDWPGYGPDFIDSDVIEPPGRFLADAERPQRPGSDACSLGAWLDKGVRGDQLGPNRAGRDW